jgi:hypothetical protein
MNAQATITTGHKYHNQTSHITEAFDVLEQESVNIPAMAAAGWYMARLIPLNARVRGTAIHIFLLLYHGVEGARLVGTTSVSGVVMGSTPVSLGFILGLLYEIRHKIKT